MRITDVLTVFRAHSGLSSPVVETAAIIRRIWYLSGVRGNGAMRLSEAGRRQYYGSGGVYLQEAVTDAGAALRVLEDRLGYDWVYVHGLVNLEKPRAELAEVLNAKRLSLACRPLTQIAAENAVSRRVEAALINLTLDRLDLPQSSAAWRLEIDWRAFGATR